MFLLDGATRGDSHALETGVLGAESMANSGLLYAAAAGDHSSVNVLYKARVEEISFRPAAWIIHFPPAMRSSAWTAASTIAHEYPKPWVEWLTYGTATAVSVTRFTSLQHFPSDVVVGSTLGYLIGRHISSMLTARLVSARYAARNN